MFTTRLARRIAAAALVAGVAFGGAAMIGAHDASDAPTEQAGVTWS
ncbi:MAG: hypothetical protein GY929_08620 [Actinomycetia bacterium]|nr:hypothetical protein [Actinomycetes bacterium]